MKVEVVVPVRRMLLLGGLVAGVIGVLWWGASPAASQEEPADLATFAFLARADNPVDALAAGALAGQLGGPVLLSGTDTLDEQAAAGLVAADPQVVVLAGGVAALSEQVEAEVAALLPDAVIRRVAGAGRTETARLLGTLPAELGIGRPVLTGVTVPGDVGIDGTLAVDGVDVTATLAALTDRLEVLEADNAALRSELDDAIARITTLESQPSGGSGVSESRVAALEATLTGVSRSGDVLTFAGMNVQVTNGLGLTASTNGLGNLIVGYNEDHTTIACQPDDADCQYDGDNAADARTGSHMLVIGPDHSYTSHSGIVAGVNHTTSGNFASVTGGEFNTASGNFASVTGGLLNTASGAWASVTGGQANTASTPFASVTGGAGNTASGVGGSVTGGSFNVASGDAASVTGGRSNTASGIWSTVAGGRSGTVADQYDSRIGNTDFPDS